MKVNTALLDILSVQFIFSFAILSFAIFILRIFARISVMNVIDVPIDPKTLSPGLKFGLVRADPWIPYVFFALTGSLNLVTTSNNVKCNAKIFLGSLPAN